MSDFEALTNIYTGALDVQAVAGLYARLHGELIFPGMANYDAARAVWNGMIDKRPALIVRCADESDVVTAVNFAREHNMLLAVRGGGHNVAGSAVCDGGLVIDLSPMRRIDVDPVSRTARAQGGVTWGELDRETQKFGLAAPGGVVSETGIAGLTLGGGLGWLRRKYGLTIDSLVSVEIVTADGRFLSASETENADLFWAVRGGGGNFGVVTSFEYRLHNVGPEVMFAFVLYPAEIAREALRFYRDYCASAPDEVSSFAIFGTVPEAPLFPKESHGANYILFAACYAGSVREGRRILQPLREFSTPIADLSAPMAFTEVQTILDEDYPSGEMRYYWKSAYVNSLDDDVIEALIAHNARRPAPHSTVDIWQLGGAMSRVSADATAFGDRSAPFLIGVESNWHHAEDDAQNIAWVRDFVAGMAQFSNGSQYLNFPGLYEEGDAMMRAAFGKNYARLAHIKRRYDPTNLFRLNQNIQPEENRATAIEYLNPSFM